MRRANADARLVIRRLRVVWARMTRVVSILNVYTCVDVRVCKYMWREDMPGICFE